MLNKDFYSTILAQVISPCGNYLVTGDTSGKLSVFHLSKITQSDVVLSKEDLLPKYKIIVKEGFQINSLLTTPQFLIVGVVGEIFGYNWKSIRTTNPQRNKPDWSIDIPNRKNTLDTMDINVINYDTINNHIFVGCGDTIYVFDLERRKLLKNLSKHVDCVNCLSNSETDLISGADDGVVNIWDLRSYKVTNKIVPHLSEPVARTELGKWIGAVSANEDYVLCGGGPRLSLWHYRFLTYSTVFPMDDKGIHVAEIYKEKILAGGRSRLFYQMSFIGDVISEIPVSAATIYSIVHQEEPHNVSCLAGSSPKVDVCSSFMYKNQQLSLY
ncbi:unnamed protein product [Psylliodes chrysocephalus]|uniref:THO complex subunit 6 n=1 Tax=Psylliodes chrysocephalus TaxID=3402493 RepID=A0A9P0CGD3_9CUCU|nr:unnamed protein product [Psylliodes chrysocephala]